MGRDTKDHPNDLDGLEKDLTKSWTHITTKWWPAVKKSWERIWDEKFSLEVRHAIADIPVEARRSTPYGSGRIAWITWVFHALVVYPLAIAGIVAWVAS